MRFLRGFSLVELLVAIVISMIILGALYSLFFASRNAFINIREVTDVKEVAKLGMAQLEWVFERWGTSVVMCQDPIGTDQCTAVIDCRDASGNFVFPPPSSLCVTIVEGDPCDSITFYGNLYGNGFVALVTGQDTVRVVSCRLRQTQRHNCYFIKRGGLTFRDVETGNPLIFSISGLSADNLDCLDPSMSPNATMNRTVTALNGNLIDPVTGESTNTLLLEGGDLLLRVPHRITLFCRPNPQDNDTLWVYMRAQDTAANCNANEPPQPLFPVESMQASIQNNGVLLDIIFRNNHQPSDPEYRTFRVQRIFGR